MIKTALMFWLLSISIGIFVNNEFVTNIFNFDHWFNLMGISISKFDLFGSFLTGLCFTFRDLSQIYFDKSQFKDKNILIQSLLIVLICVGNVIFADDAIMIACVCAFVASLTTDLVVFNICNSGYGWKMIWSSILASMIDILIYNAIAAESGFIFPVILSSYYLIFKTISSVIVGIYLEKNTMLKKMRNIKI